MGTLDRRTLLAAAAAAPLAMPAIARAQGTPLRIGVLTDMSSWGRDNGGPGSVYAVNQAIADMGGVVGGQKVEVLVGDHKMTPDLGIQIARRWFDSGVEAVADCPHSAIALGVSALAQEKNRLALFSGPGSSDITNSRCNARTVQFTYDTYATSKVTTTALMGQGARTFFFVTVDYAFGKSLQADATSFIQAGGGRVVGSVTHPAGTTDFAGLLLQAQASKADVIALCNTGQDCTNALKQAQEFGLARAGQKMAALGMFLTDVHGAGLGIAQNTLFATADYWDMNDATRTWSRAYLASVGQMPTMLQSGTYGVALHYLRAVQAAGTTEAGAVMAQMQAQPVDNIFIRNASLRGDGRVVRGMYLARVKTPEESKAPWDYLELVREVAAADAVRPVSESVCPLLRKA
ncbi:MAG: ABC transporter substrate-binding protein [Gemmatimonadaceae bacterium]|nr:ABC transporter substrate-binding protein [Acetobacteraceae bacterium]